MTYDAVEMGPVVGDDQLFAVTLGARESASTPTSVTRKTFRHYDHSQLSAVT